MQLGDAVFATAHFLLSVQKSAFDLHTPLQSRRAFLLSALQCRLQAILNAQTV